MQVIAVTTDLWPHPITEEGRRTESVECAPGTTVRELVVRAAPDAPLERWEVAVDGRTLLEDEWERGLRGGEIVVIREAAAGGFFQTLLTVALIAAAIYFPPALGLTGLAAFALQAGISIVGGLILNALFQPDVPDFAVENQAAPQVFSLAGGSNRARPFEPLPLLLGRHRVFPDLAAREYSQNVGEEQILSQVFHFGRGDIDVSDIRIGSTPIGEYEGVTVEMAGADGALALVAGNVDTITGATLSTEFAERLSSIDTMHVEVDVTGRLFRFDKKGRIKAQAVSIEVEVKFGDDNPTIHTIDLSNDDQAPYRRTLRYSSATAGRFRVRVRRLTEPSDDSKVYDELNWAALRSFQTDGGDYEGQVRMAVKIQASGQLNGRLETVSAIAQRKVPVWDADTESWGSTNEATSNPAALFRWFARGVFHDGALKLGCGLPAARIDDASLGAWYEYCEAQDLTIDAELKRPGTMESALDLIARRGEASKTWQTGRLGVVWEDRRDPAALVQPSNIVDGTFTAAWPTGALADEIVVRYVDPDSDWNYESYRAKRAGVTSVSRSVTVTAHGITRRAGAQRAAARQLARQQYLRRRLSWEMGPEGRTLTKGTVVNITEALIGGGEAGRVVGWSPATLTVTLDREVEAAANSNLLVRTAAGLQTVGVSETTQPTREIVIDEALTNFPDEPTDAIWRLYSDGSPPTRARIIGVRPLAVDRFRLTAIDDVDAYYSARGGALTPRTIPTVAAAPRVVAVQFSLVRTMGPSGTTLTLKAMLTVAGTWAGGVVRAGSVGGALATVDTLSGASDLTAEWTIQNTGRLVVEIVPGTLASPTGEVWRGAWGEAEQSPPAAPTAVGVATLGDGTRQYKWSVPEPPEVVGVEIYYSDTAGQDIAEMTRLTSVGLPTSPYEAFEPAAGMWEFAFVAVDLDDLRSLPARVSATLGAQRARGGGGAGVNILPAAVDITAATFSGARGPTFTLSQPISDFTYLEFLVGREDLAWKPTGSVKISTALIPRVATLAQNLRAGILRRSLLSSSGAADGTDQIDIAIAAVSADLRQCLAHRGRQGNVRIYAVLGT